MRPTCSSALEIGGVMVRWHTKRGWVYLVWNGEDSAGRAAESGVREAEAGSLVAEADDLLARLGPRPREGGGRRRVDAAYGQVPTHYLSLDDLIAAKESAGRDQDRADVRYLLRAKRAADEGST